MKIMLDTCVWDGVRKVLTEAGHNVIWIGDWKKDPGDIEILTLAYNDGRILITLDKEFGELAIVHNYPHNGILRLVNLSTKQQAALSIAIIEKYGDEQYAGAILTVDANRVRIRSGKT
jgi:predicted nuclease of predicted toxin-antitoxin system